MDKNEVDRLILKLINNSISERESENLANWLEKADNLKYFNEFIELNHLINSKRKFDHRYFLAEFIEKQIKPASNKTKNNYWKYAVVAASIVLLISIPFIFNKKNGQVVEPAIVNNNIKIGTDKAILTLEDGKNIILEKGQEYVADNLKSYGEEIIYKSSESVKSEIAYNYLTIPRGGQYLVKLSDGTQVWLNSESQLKYPVNFVKGETRKVELVYGEAYFDVSPSTEHQGAKFKVLTGNQEVEVLGTEFNIKAYQDENAVYTTLVEGKIAISGFDGNTKAILRPNQKSIIKDNRAGIEVIDTDVFNDISWKQGVFSFDNMPLKEIMKVLSRWYDVNVVFVDTNLENITFNGVLRKNQNIEDILKPIKSIKNITYEIKGNTIIFK